MTLSREFQHPNDFQSNSQRGLAANPQISGQDMSGPPGMAYAAVGTQKATGSARQSVCREGDHHVVGSRVARVTLKSLTDGREVLSHEFHHHSVPSITRDWPSPGDGS